ncbi:Rossmann-like domain-containing protein [Thermodesulfobacteriota bacterium]
MDDLYKELRERTHQLLIGQDLLGQKVRIQARALSTEEAIGNPESDDLPLQKGKERLMQAEFGNALGQAFTDRYGDFEGTLEEILEMNLENNYRRAIFVASLNAVLRHMGQIDRTVHCRDREPALCAEKLRHYIKTHYGWKRIVLIGFQPRMVESLAPHYPLRVIDMDPANMGTRKFQIAVEGPEATEEAVRWTDLLLVTGTTLVNGTIGRFLKGKPILFYGTTIAGAAHLMGWDRLCFKGT